MGDKSLSDIAKKIKGIDIAMLSTHTDNGQIANRPMSNNGDVDYDGDSFYFTVDTTRMVRDIEHDANVALAFAGESGLLTGNSLYIAVEGVATLIRDKATFQKHWTPDLDLWFDDGVDTPGLVLIQVHAKRIKFWDGTDEGELLV